MSEGKEVRDVIVSLCGSDKKITDIHIEAEENPRSKQPSGWEEDPSFGPVTNEMLEEFIKSMWGEHFKTILQQRGSLDRSLPMGDHRLRINAFTIREGQRYAISVRKHPLTPMKIDNISMGMQAKSMLKIASRGLFVVTGATGSGKTTTLAALLDYYNSEAVGARNMERKLHIHSIEDPIEFVHARKNAIMTQKAVGIDCPSFAAGLKESLRQRPDIIMIGEVRDRETAETMLAAAESGHLVLATMHTNSAPAVINKILSFFPEDQHKMILSMLSSNLIGVSCQVMLPNYAYDGWVVATELLLNENNKVGTLIAEGNTASIVEMMKKPGTSMSYMNHELVNLYKKKEVTGDAAIRASSNPMELMEMVNSK